MQTHRGDIKGDFYDQFYQKAWRIDIIGIACQKFLRNLYPSNGAAVVTEPAQPRLQDFKQTALFRALQDREDLTVNACFLNPTAPFVKTRMDEEGNPACRQHILDGINAVRQFYRDLIAASSAIRGSLNIKLIQRNLYLSTFRVLYNDGQPDLVRAGILVQGSLGMECPEIAFKNKGPLRDVFTTLSTHTDVLQTDAHVLFRWADGKKPEFYPNYPMLSDYDVLLLHNSRDKVEIERIRQGLLRRGKLPWVDKWALPSASSQMWVKELEKAIGRIPCTAVCLGPHGTGPWQDLEIPLVLERRDRTKIIPVQLPGLKQHPDGFLLPFQWINFDENWEQGLDELVHRIDADRPQYW